MLGCFHLSFSRSPIFRANGAVIYSTFSFCVAPMRLWLPLQAAGGPPNPVATGYTIGGSASRAFDGLTCSGRIEDG
jgi:hypothetical protein